MQDITSANGNTSESMNFDQVLDVFSVFSYNAPFTVKCIYAFRIYDVDCDGFIGRQDIFDIAALVRIGCNHAII